MHDGLIWIEWSLLSLLVVCAIIIARRQKLFSAVMLTGIFSFIGACWMLMLDAPDVAFTEAAVGAGIATVLFVSTLALTSDHAKRARRRDIAPFFAVILTGAVLIYGTFDMPRATDENNPAQSYVGNLYIERTAEDFHIPNMVTAVLAGYRGYDTFGETTVILTAALGVLLLLRSLEGTQFSGRLQTRGLGGNKVLRIVAKMLIPYIVLFGFYVQFHGDYGPGGGFQAGVIVASAIILYALIFGLGPTQRVLPERWVEIGIALGVLIYGGVGIATMLLGGNFLDYAVFSPHHPVHARHYGILAIELGVGLTVASVMLAIFYAFTARGRAR